MTFSDDWRRAKGGSAVTRRCDVVVEGPLAPFAAEFWEQLGRLGYKNYQANRQMGLVAHLSGWMVERGICPGELSTEMVDDFFCERRRLGHAWLITAMAARPLLGFLREANVVPVPSRPAPANPAEALLERYREFLVHQRGLVPATVAHYGVAAQVFVEAVGAHRGRDLGSLTAAEVSCFITAACTRPVKMSARELVSALRSFLRFLHIEGVTAGPLSQAVPAYASWGASSLPRPLLPEQTARLLGSCDRRTARGRRDYAVLVLLVRLGLRAGEVAGLRLDDIDWHAGELRVRGKGPREERLPLPCDVGEAVVGYLRRGRPEAESRAVFLRAIAPLMALCPTGVSWVVYDACDRAGLARVGAHRLRHSAATDMLRAGASLAEVGQVLRHRRAGTTAIYAKVDHTALCPLARPWPGERS